MDYRNNIKMNKALFIIFLSIVFFGEVKSQDFSNEERYRTAWNYRIDTNKLIFDIPTGFSTIRMDNCNYGMWDCKNRQTYAFHRVLVSLDSSVVVGLRIDYNYTWTSPTGELMSTKVNWAKNAAGLYDFLVDRNNKSVVLDSVLLAKHWDAEYGMKFTKEPCNISLYKKYRNIKNILIGNKDFQILMGYFYKDEFKYGIDSLIDNTITMIRKR